MTVFRQNGCVAILIRNNITNKPMEFVIALHHPTTLSQHSQTRSAKVSLFYQKIDQKISIDQIHKQFRPYHIFIHLVFALEER